MAAASTHYMYVLECADGSLYTGYAVDVQARLAVHNAGKGAKYTRARLPVSLLAYAEFATKHDAMHAEYVFKQLSRNEKDALLAAGGPEKRAYLTCPMGRPKRGSKSHRFHESGGKCQFDPEMVRGGKPFRL